jgi:hypothetical protein
VLPAVVATGLTYRLMRQSGQSHPV